MPAQALGAALATEPDPDIWHKDIVDGVHYPSSDGEPMSDNQWQGKAIIHAASDLEVAFPDAMVASDLLVYPEEGNPKNRVAPDVLVAFDIGSHKRPSYRVWQEGKPPDWVLEVVSPRTGRRDLEEKPLAYARMGVPEYWLFDPTGGDQLPPGEPDLQGWKLVDGTYQPLAARLENGVKMIRSDVLGLDLRAENELIRFRDPATGQDIPHHGEAQADANRFAATARREATRANREATRANREAARADREAAARRAAEERLAVLEAAIHGAQTPNAPPAGAGKARTAFASVIRLLTGVVRRRR